MRRGADLAAHAVGCARPPTGGARPRRPRTEVGRAVWTLSQIGGRPISIWVELRNDVTRSSLTANAGRRGLAQRDEAHDDDGSLSLLAQAQTSHSSLAPAIISSARCNRSPISASGMILHGSDCTLLDQKPQACPRHERRRQAKNSTQ
jgi:hypothetical protein